LLCIVHREPTTAFLEQVRPLVLRMAVQDRCAGTGVMVRVRGGRD
jgi:hypothetical protein